MPGPPAGAARVATTVSTVLEPPRVCVVERSTRTVNPGAARPCGGACVASSCASASSTAEPAVTGAPNALSSLSALCAPPGSNVWGGCALASGVGAACSEKATTTRPIRNGRSVKRYRRRSSNHRQRNGPGVERRCRSADLPTFSAEADGRTPDTHSARRRRAVDPDVAHVPAAPGRLRGRSRLERHRGARALRRGRVRPRRARRDDADRRRPRGVPPDARVEFGADHHAHREGR